MRSVKNSLRLIRVALILARHRALFIVADVGITGPLCWLAAPFSKSSTPKGERIARALEQLGPSFIKLGQTLSTRADLVGEEIAASLASLQDNLPPFKSAIAKRMIEEDLRKPLSALFTHFGEVPVGAASIAQVHRAITHAGAPVAVKVLRPNITQAFTRDIELFFWLAELLERRMPKWRRLKPVQVIEFFRDTVRLELDLRYEAASAAELSKNTLLDAGFHVPAVDWNLSAERVLTTEWVEGIPISDVAALQAAGHDVNKLTLSIAENFFKQVFRDGFFHADLHPGNVFVDAAGDIAVVDFGIMGRLDWKSRMYVAEILKGFLEEDFKRVAEVHFRAGYVPAHQSVENFTLACTAIAKPILGKPLHEISVASLLGQLFKVTEQFEMETQPQLLLLQKTMVVVEGIGRMLNPNTNMWEMAKAPIEAWAREHMGARGRLKEIAMEGLEHLKELPNVLERFNQTLARFSNKDGVKLHPDTVAALAEASTHYPKSWYVLMLAVLGLLGVIAYQNL